MPFALRGLNDRRDRRGIDAGQSQHVDLLGEQAVAAGDPLRGRALAVAVEPLRAELLERDAERVVGAVGRLDAADDVEVADAEAPRLHLRACGLAGLRAGHDGDLAERAADGADAGSGHLARCTGGREIRSAEPEAYEAPGTTGSPAGGAALDAPKAIPVSVRSSAPLTSTEMPSDRCFMCVPSLGDEWHTPASNRAGVLQLVEIDGPSSLSVPFLDRDEPCRHIVRRQRRLHWIRAKRLPPRN